MWITFLKYPKVKSAFVIRWKKNSISKLCNCNLLYL
jgi:hypothetical protein